MLENIGEKHCDGCAHVTVCYSYPYINGFAAQAPLAISIKSLDGKYRFVNYKFSSLFNKNCREIIGHTDTDLFQDEIARRQQSYDDEVMARGCAIEHEEVLTSESDQTYSLHTHRFPLIDPRGETYAICTFMSDITAYKQQQAELTRISRGVEYSSSAIIITDLSGTIEYVNQKFTDITGYSKQEVLGKNPSILHSGETDKSYYAALWETIESGGEWKSEIYNQKKDGSYYWARNSISGIKNQLGEITNYIAIQDDVTREHQLAEELSYQSSHDELTGLINRREFERRATQLIDHSEHALHALCYMDIDQFKIINDTSGHIAGDELLRQVSHLLQNSVRSQDTLARLGGDEFGLIMQGCSLEQAQRVVDVLLNNIQEFQFIWESQSFRIGISIGLVAITSAVDNLTELLKQADSACYMAKELGRNRVHVYHPEDQQLAQRHGKMQWISRINHALEQDRFCLYAQPIRALSGDGEKHYEILLRMLDEGGAVIMPAHFIPAAESYNLMGKLDSWVISTTFAMLQENPDFVNSIDSLSINLGGQTLTDSNMLAFIVDEFKRSQIQAHKICFEVTETVAISNFSTAKAFIHQLKRLGCKFALDDFGSGLSSFGYLKNLPVDFLKIDGMFVKDILSDDIDHAMVASIHNIGKVMGIQTIAEFVENEQILEKLRQIGVDYVQGFGIGKPQPLHEIFQLSG